MNTVQTNVRVQPDDKPLVRAIAARLRIEPRFRERLKALIEDDPAPQLKERVEKLEEQVEWLLSGGASTSLKPSAMSAARVAANGGHASHGFSES